MAVLVCCIFGLRSQVHNLNVWELGKKHKFLNPSHTLHFDSNVFDLRLRQLRKSANIFLCWTPDPFYQSSQVTGHFIPGISTPWNLEPQDWRTFQLQTFQPQTFLPCLLKLQRVLGLKNLWLKSQGWILAHHSKTQKDGWAKYIPNFPFKWC